MKTKYVMITVTERCNLNCMYCYEKNKTLRNADLSLAIRIIEQELNEDDEYDLCEITLHGGEPFLVFPLIQELCQYFWQREWKKSYYFFTSTNGTLVTQEIKQWLFLHRKEFICGLSIDGNKVMQDLNRCNSFDLIDIDFFVNTWPFQEVKVTISDKTLPYLAKGLIFLHEMGFKVADNFAYGIDWSDRKNSFELEKQLKDLMSYYLEHPEIQPSRLLSVKLEYLSCSIQDERTCGIGKGMKVYDIEGNQYACHYFEPLSVGKDAAAKSLAINFKDIDKYKDQECLKCPLKVICPTCYGANYAATGNVALRDKNMCSLTMVSAYATAQFLYKKIQKYGVESLSKNRKKQKSILKGIIKMQEVRG